MTYTVNGELKVPIFMCWAPYGPTRDPHSALQNKMKSLRRCLLGLRYNIFQEQSKNSNGIRDLEFC